MSRQISCGLLMFRRINNFLEIFLVHPGGPYFKNKNMGTWSIPKGISDSFDVDMLETAKREFEEEVGFLPVGNFFPLGNVVQNKYKIVYCWGFETHINKDIIVNSNLTTIEYPAGSSLNITIPEVDEGKFFNVSDAIIAINAKQSIFIHRLIEHLKS